MTCMKAYQEVTELVSIDIVSHLEVSIQQGCRARGAGLLLAHSGAEEHVTLKAKKV